jgi:hypothetical protein
MAGSLEPIDTHPRMKDTKNNPIWVYTWGWECLGCFRRGARAMTGPGNEQHQSPPWPGGARVPQKLHCPHGTRWRQAFYTVPKLASVPHSREAPRLGGMLPPDEETVKVSQVMTNSSRSRRGTGQRTQEIHCCIWTPRVDFRNAQVPEDQV